MPSAEAVGLVAGLLGVATGSVACYVSFYGVRSDRQAERLLASHELGWRFEAELQQLLPDLWRLAEDEPDALQGEHRALMNRLFSLYSQVYRAAKDDLLRDSEDDWNGLRNEFRFWASKPLGALALDALVVQQQEYWPRGFAAFASSETARAREQ